MAKLEFNLIIKILAGLFIFYLLIGYIIYKDNIYKDEIMDKQDSINAQVASFDMASMFDPRDSKIYKTIEMPNGKIWFAENLNYKIENILSNEYDDSYLLPSNFMKNNDSSWCSDFVDSKDDDFKCEKFGRLYNWEAATIACPAGWHLPSHYEWFNLFKLIDDSTVVSKKLKSKMFASNAEGVFAGIWWTATEDNSVNNYSVYTALIYASKYTFQTVSYGEEPFGLHVRCVKD